MGKEDLPTSTFSGPQAGLPCMSHLSLLLLEGRIGFLMLTSASPTGLAPEAPVASLL